MRFVIAFGGLGVLLLAGLLLRTWVGPLRKLLLPVSVIGGFVGLAIGPYSADWVSPEVMEVWASLPGVLINFVFACLFLGVVLPSGREFVHLGGPLLRFSAITSLGQYAVGLLLTWVLLEPVFGTSELFACVLEVGFAGGHGTAAAMGPVFDELGFEAGAALGQMSATVGIVVAVVSGIALIHWGMARGHTTEIAGAAGGLQLEDAQAFVAEDQRRPNAYETVRPAAIDTLTLHVAITGVAVLLGWIMLTGLRATHDSLSGFPLFPLAMVGGMLVQFVARRTGTVVYFDRSTFQRIMGLSLDLLIVAAIASLRLDLFLQNLIPFSLLMLAGILWVVVAFVFIAPRLMERHWFEQTITAYGSSTGVTAIGLMLMRIVDPENRTPAAEAFAASRIVVSPIFGGGLLTASVPLLMAGFGLPAMFGATTVAGLAFYFWPRFRSEAAQ
ncbi:MAG: sodium/glutamate symporter [Longimicrobiales bacterium]